MADAYTSGRSKGETNFKPTGGYASYEDDITKEAYQAGKDKALSEHNATSRAGTDTSPNTGYLAAAGATLAGAVGAVGATLAGGKSSKEQDVEDSLIEDAEKVDPAIAKLPSHRVNKGELAKEETLGKDASVFEKNLSIQTREINGKEKLMIITRSMVLLIQRKVYFKKPKMSILVSTSCHLIKPTRIN